MDITQEEIEKFEKRKNEMMADKYEFNHGITSCINLTEEMKKKQAESRIILSDTYLKIMDTLKKYMILRDDYYNLLSVWIIGTYFYKEFQTYPYLFINAMRGSGKSRLLKLIKALAWNGELLGSMKEAVLFRTAEGNTLCIDEFEGLGSKDNAALREVLNAGYKKGMKVKRMRKVHTKEGEQQIAEEFDVYSPKVMANIWGMEEVLADRALTLILEKNNQDYRSKLAENFDDDLIIKTIKANLSIGLVQLCSYFSEKNIYTGWNEWLKLRYEYTTTHITYTTLTTQITQTTYQNLDLEEFFLAVDDSGINGRDLELFFPLLMVAKVVSAECFKETMEIAKKLQKERRVDELTESRDMLFLEYVAGQADNNQYIAITELTSTFRMEIGDEEENRWITTHWVGRAIKRLNLAVDKVRMAKGVQVRLNVQKAKDKLAVVKS